MGLNPDLFIWITSPEEALRSKLNQKADSEKQEEIKKFMRQFRLLEDQVSTYFEQVETTIGECLRVIEGTSTPTR